MPEFRTRDDPEANGRKPKIGDERWTVTLPLDDGSDLIVRMGRESRDMIFGMMIADCHDSGEEEPK